MRNIQFATWNHPEDIPVDIPCIGAGLISETERGVIMKVRRLCHNVFLVYTRSNRYLVYDHDATYCGRGIKRKKFVNDLSVIGSICKVAYKKPIKKGKPMMIFEREYGSTEKVRKTTSEVKHITRIAIGLIKVETVNGSVYYVMK